MENSTVVAGKECSSKSSGNKYESAEKWLIAQIVGRGCHIMPELPGLFPYD